MEVKRINTVVRTQGFAYKIDNTTYLAMNDGRYWRFVEMNENPLLKSLTRDETDNLARAIAEKMAPKKPSNKRGL